jgi:hypothetical protein
MVGDEGRWVKEGKNDKYLLCYGGRGKHVQTKKTEYRTIAIPDRTFLFKQDHVTGPILSLLGLQACHCVGAALISADDVFLLINQGSFYKRGPRKANIYTLSQDRNWALGYIPLATGK